MIGTNVTITDATINNKNIATTVYPHISFNPNPDKPNAGRTKNGCIKFVTISPMVTVLTAIEAGSFNAKAASTIIGPWICHCPPADGTNTFTIAADINDNNGNVNSLDTATKDSETTVIRPDPTIIPIIPA